MKFRTIFSLVLCYLVIIATCSNLPTQKPLVYKGLIQVNENSEAKPLVSEMMTDKGLYDPIAAKFLANMISEMLKSVM